MANSIFGNRRCGRRGGEFITEAYLDRILRPVMTLGYEVCDRAVIEIAEIGKTVFSYPSMPAIATA
jgi:hypothetical protein